MIQIYNRLLIECGKTFQVMPIGKVKRTLQCYYKESPRPLR
jgi:hypothetical protein